MINKKLLNSEVWTKGGYDSEMGYVDSIFYGKVVRQTLKSIWIADERGTYKWNIKPNGRWSCPAQFTGKFEKDFDFKLDPLIKFIFNETE